MGEKTKKAYDEAAACYDAEPNAVLFTETAAVLELLGAGPGDSVLDAACGTGKYLLETRRLGAECAGLDFSEKMLVAAAAKCPGARLVNHDLERLPLPFADGEFSRVVFSHGLRHVGNIAGLFREFARLLRPGGALVATITHPAAEFRLFKYRAPDLDTGEEPDLAGEKFAHTRGDIEAAAAGAGLALAGSAEITVDERLEQLLTPESFRAASGKPLILALKFSRQKR